MISDKNLNTAVLYFALTPEAQAKEKNFVSGLSLKSNKKIAHLLQAHTRRQIKRSGLPCFKFDEHNQAGSTFGEKITQAFIDLFKQGYNNVIAVGNDTPEIRADHLLQASKLLISGESSIILGPAVDGGTWLIGFQKRAFNSETFHSLPWNTSYLLSALLSNYRHRENITQFEYLGDIDQLDDLNLFLTSRSKNEDIRKLSRILFKVLFLNNFVNAEKRITPKQTCLISSFFQRGPPDTSDYVRYSF